MWMCVCSFICRHKGFSRNSSPIAVRLVGIYEKIHYYERQLLRQESIGSCRAPVAVAAAKDCIIYLAPTGNQETQPHILVPTRRCQSSQIPGEKKGTPLEKVTNSNTFELAAPRVASALEISKREFQY